MGSMRIEWQKWLLVQVIVRAATGWWRAARLMTKGRTEVFVSDHLSGQLMTYDVTSLHNIGLNVTSLCSVLLYDSVLFLWDFDVMCSCQGRQLPLDRESIRHVHHDRLWILMLGLKIYSLNKCSSTLLIWYATRVIIALYKYVLISIF